MTLGLIEYFQFYNDERPHAALANGTPTTIYREDQGGGALIVDKYGPGTTSSAEPQETGQRCAAANEAQAIA